MPRARKYDGVVYRRAGTEIWWIRYRDRKGVARRESSLTADCQQANKKLRERLQTRDDNLLEVVRKGETLAYEQWADFFLENYSKPPVRAEKTRGEQAVYKTPKGGIWYKPIGGHHCGFD